VLLEKVRLFGTPADVAYEARTIETYRPDFSIRFSTLVEYLEVKPVFPNGEYIAMLQAKAVAIGKDGYQLTLAVGGFFDGNEPRLWPYPYHVGYPGFLLTDYWWEVDQAALEAVRNFRWDLPYATEREVAN
jgi:hypothetical protein